MGNLLGSSSSPVSKEDALPSNENEMQVTNEHFVLKTPIKAPFPDNIETCVFGNGCFWGSEKGFWRLPGVYSTAVGYAGGITRNPTYKQVCSGRTGHNEVVLVAYDPAKISFTDLLRWFWESHDPTQGMGQGNDRGTQYRSGIYCSNDEQVKLAKASKDAYEKALQSAGRGMSDTITTEIVLGDSKNFFYAEDYHQQYLAKPGARPYCSAQPQVVSCPPSSEWSGVEGGSEKLPEAFWKQYAPSPHCVIKSPDAKIEWPPTTFSRGDL